MAVEAGPRPDVRAGEERTTIAADRRSRPVLVWAALGALLVAFELVVLARWIAGSDLTSTRPGSSPVSTGTHVLYLAIQIAVPIGTLVVVWLAVIRPWRREGRMTTRGMIAVACGTLFFWDMGMNYTSVSLLYNSHLLNLGAWANGSFPGWTAPNAHLLPEPLLVCLPGYTAICFVEIPIALGLLKGIKRRWPEMRTIATVAWIVVLLTLVDTVFEIILLRIGVYAYPGGIRAITLFAGHTYQLPMTEPFFFAGLGLGTAAVLLHFQDAQGRTLVERGIDRVNVGARGRQAVKFLAIFGAVHGLFIVSYFVPNQWLATHSGPWPKGYPSYMINGMCDYPGGSGAHQTHEAAGVACPGPGVPIVRPSTAATGR